MSKNRGMFLESIINKTIRAYESNDIAIFHKKPIEITFNKITNNKVDTGWVRRKSTVDYYGIYKGRYIAFEAKSTRETSLPFSNIKSHQSSYLNKIANYGGIGFFIVYFDKYNKFFAIKASDIFSDERKSISFNEIKKRGISISLVYPGILDFISVINNWL